MPSTWDPDQYHRFRDERSRPFFDLLDLVEPCPGGAVIDLGCGTGELTRILHERSGAATTLGLDSSDTMLAKAGEHAGPGLRFATGDIAQFSGQYDLVFSNAALQWLDGHEALIPKIAAHVAPGGQLAFQVPANADHPSHLVAHSVAREEPYATALGGYVRDWPVLPPERYAEILDRLGFRDLTVRLEVYGHHLESSGGVVEWVKGTLLTDYQKRMPAGLFERYLARYRELLLGEIGMKAPYFYAFKRVLARGRAAD
ncbi:methyltransferase domain-containing protein [Candidatus Amarobacter glycogenicus]|uniref:methyltransferase domain-containing protein n=1 Tax=Candidatus Amarobacter glycogenicus TaxID=3140699 RepID=UPI003135DA23|nr:methyltransferase domain-containing protein [Dehalococcoidia bacterium]